MMNKTIPRPITVERLKELFEHNPITGFLRWKERKDIPARWADRWNGRFAGKVAGSRMTSGHISVCIDGRTVYCHRIIWMMSAGEEIPGGYCIDHINQDPADNRYENLRLATKSENGRNRGATKRNKKGLKGVVQAVSGSGWRARIMVDGATRHLGTFPDANAAHKAYAEAAAALHGDFASG